LGGISRYALGKEDNGVLSVPSPVSRGKHGLVQDLSPPSGHDGFVTVCGPAGLAENEELPALGCGEASVPTTAPRTQSENYHGVRDGSSSVEKPLCIPDRSPVGERVSEKSSDNGRIPDGMGSCFSGQIDKRLHINMLELMAVFLALKHFRPFLEGFHVLVRTDNTTVVAYINRQGGTRSLQLHNLARKLIVWSAAHFSSLRATHVPGVLNVGADLLSRGNPLYGEWVLHPQVVNQIWEIYGKAA
ncbi:hypothetical protein M9458_041839, partial [Cirrhinus mrigala]